jgi:hypothetical protein
MDKSSNINDFNQTIQQHVSSQTFGNITVKNETIISRTTSEGVDKTIAIKTKISNLVRTKRFWTQSRKIGKPNN